MQQASRWTECVYMLLALEVNGRSQAPCLLFSPLNPPFELLFFSRSTRQQRLMRRSSSAGQDHAAACFSLMLRRCSWQSGSHQQRCVGLAVQEERQNPTAKYGETPAEHALWLDPPKQYRTAA